jgi:hypothetical protein
MKISKARAQAPSRAQSNPAQTGRRLRKDRDGYRPSIHEPRVVFLFL